MRQKDVNWNIIFAIIMLSVVMLIVFATLVVYRGELDDLKDEIENLKAEEECENGKFKWVEDEEELYVCDISWKKVSDLFKDVSVLEDES